MRKKRRNRQRKIVVFSLLAMLCVMSIGYAAFNTVLNITAKANIKKQQTITSEDLKALAITSGDGLYADTYEDGRYMYRGANPDNYITFNNETWRIISVEVDNTIKIVRNLNEEELAWDEAGNGD